MTGNNDAFVIRTARRGDMAEIAVMAKEFEAFLSSLDGSEPGFDAAAAAAALKRWGFGAQPLFSALIAESEDGAAGYAIYSPMFWADSMEAALFMSDLYVREAWRGKGLGQAFMAELAERGRAQDCGLLLWSVWTENPAAQRFYAGLGADRLDDELLMSLKL